MWTQHKPRVPLGVIAMISKGCFWQISNIIIKFVFRAFLYFNPSTVHGVLNWYWVHFDKSYRENQIGVWSRSCLWLLIAHQESVSYKLRTSWALSIYTFKPVCETTFETYWGKLQNLLGIKFTTEANSLFFSAVNNGIFVYFLWHRCVDYQINWINKYFLY